MTQATRLKKDDILKGLEEDLSSASASPIEDEEKGISSDENIGKSVSAGAILREKATQKRPLRNNATKNYKEESTPTSDDEQTDSSATFDSSDTDSDEFVPYSKKKKFKENQPINFRRIFREENGANSKIISPFEAQRRKNIEERMRVFKELELDKAVKDLEDACRNPKKLRPINQEPNPVRQKSSRIKAMQTEQLQSRDTAGPNNASCDRWVLALDGNKTLSMSDTIFNPFNNADFTDYFQRLGCKLQDKNPMKCDVDLRHCSMDEFQSKVSSLTLRKEQNLKILPTQITSLNFHPSQSAMLIAAGGKTGTVGLWNVNVEAGDWDDSNIIVFELHSAQVNCVTFSNNDPDAFFTSSSDGNLYKGNLDHKIFQLLYSTKNKSPIFYHSEQSLHTMYVAQDAGEVTKIDTRMESYKHDSFRCHHDAIRTLCMSPSSRHHMLTCSDDANVSMWDLRVMSKQGLSGRLCNFTLDSGVASAFFSPVNGSRILVTLPSNTVCIYDTQWDGSAPFKTWEVQQNKAMRSTRPARYPFKAMWHPRREDFFCVGRNCPPYGVDVFKCNYSMGSFSSHSSVLLETQRCTLAEFHPTYPAVATSSSTNVHLFL